MALVAASAATISFDLHVSLSLSPSCTPRSEIAVYLPPSPPRLAHTRSSSVGGGETCTHTAAAAADQITWPLALPATPLHSISHRPHSYHITITGQHCNRPQTDGRSCRDLTSDFVSWTHCENYGATSLRANGLIASSYWCVVSGYWSYTRR